jgi:two-component system sensor histidine kinase RegB
LFGPQPDQPHWLLQLRWWAVVGQLVTIAVAVGLMGLALPIPQLLGLVALTTITNGLYGGWCRRRGMESRQTASPVLPWEGRSLASGGAIEVALLTLDLVTLGLMLYFSGGPNNPFVVFYFVNLAVGAILLPPRWAWALTGLSVLSYGILLLAKPAFELVEPAHALGRLDWAPIEAQGQFVAFAACAVVLTYFISQLAEQLVERQRQLRSALQQQANSQRLEALTTLAAGAAHELATPLSTIAVVARELDRHLTSGEGPGRLRQDLRLIDGELNHCRQILSRMRGSAGDRSAERIDLVTVGDLLDQVVEGIRQPERVEIIVPEDLESWQLRIPLEAVAQSLRNLIHNGLEASAVEHPVELSVRRPFDSTLGAGEPQGQLIFEVRDRGHGIPAHILQHVGEPFFTTKQPGHGTGLGLFLTRNVVQRLGGELAIESRPEQGTLVRVTLPASDAPTGPADKTGQDGRGDRSETQRLRTGTTT